MALTAAALTDLDAVRLFLQKTSTDQAQDDVIEMMIEAASELVMRECQRELIANDAAQTRVFAYNGGEVLDLAPYDVRSVTGIVVDPGTPRARTLQAGEYHARPLPAPDGVHTYLKLPGLDGHRRRQHVGEHEIAITGMWGFPQIPKIASQATIMAVAIWLRREVAKFATTFNSDEGRVERPEALPAAAARMLRHLKRPVIG